ncbi:MAG: hypothetical protein JXA20_09280 [Spirochaetes bacterium]|nr:hypothetical protein [Spirochaetota bacterium]
MKRKRIAVFTLLGLILFLCGVFSGHDWTLYFMRGADLGNPEIYSRFMKFPVTFTCMVLTWMILGDGFHRRDTQKLRIAYSLIVLGDIVFFFNVHSVIGVYCFALAHLLLIYRNAAGIRGYGGRWRLLALLPAILGASMAIMFLVFYPMLRGNLPYFYTLLGYAVIISGSLWAALAAFRIGFFPRGNAVLVAIGVACFFLSDVCVGFYRSLPPGYERVFATYITWVFYAPALALTALSGYDLKKLFG